MADNNSSCDVTASGLYRVTKKKLTAFKLAAQRLKTDRSCPHISLVNEAYQISEPLINLKYKSNPMWELKCILIVEI